MEQSFHPPQAAAERAALRARRDTDSRGRWLPIGRDASPPISLTIPRVKFQCLFALVCLLVPSCAPPVTRGEAIATAHRYTQIQWMPREENILHGPDSDGIMVKTPDRSLERHGDGRGWWEPGMAAQSMPYQWGGFDTPESFLEKIALGKKAGDIADDAKQSTGDAGTSRDACGIDCSGFVSRCWNLKRPYSTREFHRICDPLESWDELRPGDILLNHRHVVLFAKWQVVGKELVAYESGPLPDWRVSAGLLSVPVLKKNGYHPWRYRGLRD
jgi:hypothetical protein